MISSRTTTTGQFGARARPGKAKTGSGGTLKVSHAKGYMLYYDVRVRSMIQCLDLRVVERVVMVISH